MREYCLNGSFDGELPRLDNPAGPNQIVEGFEVIGPNGNVIVGVVPDKTDKPVSGEVDIDNGTIVIPPGIYDDDTPIKIETEEMVVTPTDKEQVIVPTGGKVIIKVIIKPVPDAGVILPDLTNPAGNAHILKGYEAIDENGDVIVGTMVPAPGGADLPELSNPADETHILKGYDVIDQNGNVLVGTNDLEEQNALLEARLAGGSISDPRAEAGLFEGTLSEVSGYVSKYNLSDEICVAVVDGEQRRMPGSELVDYYTGLGFLPEDVVFFEHPPVTGVA